jgi:hypothetical protein
VAGDVDDSPRASHRCVDDSVCIRLDTGGIRRANEGKDVRNRITLFGAISRLQRTQTFDDCRRFLARPEEPRVLRPVARRIPDDKHAVIDRRVVYRAGRPGRTQLAQQLRSNGPRAIVPASGRTAIEELPWDASRTLVHFDHRRGAASHERLEIHGHEQTEKCAADLRVRIGIVRSCGDQVTDERDLRGLCSDFTPSALSVDRVDDALLVVSALLCERANEVVVCAAIPGLGRTTQRPDPFLNFWTHGV